MLAVGSSLVPVDSSLRNGLVPQVVSSFPQATKVQYSTVKGQRIKWMVQEMIYESIQHLFEQVYRGCCLKLDCLRCPAGAGSKLSNWWEGW